MPPLPSPLSSSVESKSLVTDFALAWGPRRHAVPYDLPRFGGVTLPEETLYLDNAAATPLCVAAFEAMTPWLLGLCGNPANRLHPIGELAEHAVAQARAVLARACGVTPEEIIFTANATEANNLVLRGLVGSMGCARDAGGSPLRKRHRIVVGATEHSSLMATALRLAEADARVDVVVLPVDANGQIDVPSARALIDEQTLCLALMDVNNETGVVQGALGALAAHAQSQGALVHVDAVQGFARGDFGRSAESRQAYDTAVLSGAKMNGPKGAAALVVRKRKPRVRLEPQLTGGGQEGNLRSGTLNVPAIVGFARAVEWYEENRASGLALVGRLEDAFLGALRSELAGRIEVRVHGAAARRVPGIASVHLEGVNAMKLIEEARVVCLSVGSACRTLQATASHVLLAMGLSEEEALASFRASFGLCNTQEEAVLAATLLARAAIKVQSYSAVLR